MAVAPDLAPGQRFGSYRISRLLGRGGMGAVYAAEQVDDGRQVAVKILTSGLGSPEDRARFIREGHTAASINHPNTVYVYRTEEIDGLPTITMELVDGGTLEEKVEKNGPLPIPEAISDILQVIDGLEAAQKLGILHRDIKPANCFVGPRGEVKVGDFGLSRPVDQVEQSRLTQTGLFLGTPVFSSPEQLMGEPLDLRSDIYALGATLYFLLTGKLPYDADNAVRLIAVVMSGTPTPITTYRADIPPALDALIMRCLARPREERFEDYAALRAALVACLPVEQEPAPLVRRLAAGIIDAWIIGMIGSALFSLFKPADLNMADYATDPRLPLRQALFALPVELLWYAVLEGLTGWSVGKRLLGLRVATPSGAVPGVLRGAVRALLITAPGLSGAITVTLVSDMSTRQVLVPLLYVVGFALLFSRARKSNGFAGEHDRLTGTRVVRNRASAERHRIAGTTPRADTLLAAPTASFGPYEVTGLLPAAPHVMAGMDAALRRSVWILQHPVGAAALSENERSAIRAGTARWLGGRRTDDVAWDAYAATSGVPLRDRLAHPFDWRELHAWLSDLVDELIARNDDGAAVPASIDRVLITDEGHALVVPFSFGESGTRETPGADSANAATPTVLRQLADSITRPATAPQEQPLASLVTAAPHIAAARASWPLSATTLLSQIAAGTLSLSEIRDALRGVAERTTPMTAKRRATLWATGVIPLVTFAVFSSLMSNLLNPTNTDVARMQPLLSFIRDTTATTDSVARQKHLVAVYLVSNYRARIAAQRSVTDTVLGSAANGFISRREWAIADSIERAMPNISPAESLQAARLVDTTWSGRPPGVLRKLALIPVMIAVSFSLFAAILAFVAALTVRRGLLMRLFGLELVNARGERAGRLRLLWRQLLVWLPIAGVVGPALMISMEKPTMVPLAMLVVSTVALLGSLWSVWRNPSRGIAERLSGTTMVPE